MSDCDSVIRTCVLVVSNVLVSLSSTVVAMCEGVSSTLIGKSWNRREQESPFKEVLEQVKAERIQIAVSRQCSGPTSQ